MASDGDKDIDEVQRELFRNLTIAHKSSLLVYSKDSDSTKLAKKLRPEFEKIYVTGDFTEALNMISGARVRNSNLVDLIIADGDLASVKLVEAANARPLALATSKLPVISTIILLDKHNEVEIREELRKTGGCNYILEKKHGGVAPYSTFAVMNAILDTLRRRRLVEYSYRDLRENVHKEYPHLAVFEDVQDTDSNLTAAGNNTSMAMSPNDSCLLRSPVHSPTGTINLNKTPGVGGVGHHGQGHGHHGHRHSSASKAEASLTTKQLLEEKIRKEEEDNEIGCDELDDWTASSSMLPSFVKQNRKESAAAAAAAASTTDAAASLLTKDTTATTTTAAAAIPVGFPAPKTKDLQLAISERRAADSEVVKKLTQRIKDRGDEPMRDNTSVVVDAYEKSQEILNKHREDARAAMERNKKANADSRLPLLQPSYVEKVYAESKRPQWGYGDGSERERSMMAEVELKQFIPRPVVNLQHRQRLTVAGLDKKMVGACWNMISGAPRAKPVRANVSGTVSELSPLIVHRNTGGHNTSSVVSASAAAALAVAASESMYGGGGGGGDSLDGSGSLCLSLESAFGRASVDTSGGAGGRSSQKRRTMYGELEDTSSHGTTAIGIGSGVNRPHVTSISAPSMKQKIKAKKKGVKLLNKLAAHTPMESQFCQLLEMDISQCQVSSREKELLRHGKLAENDKDYDLAIRCYERSTVTTKKPHISLQFIGFNLYIQKRYLDSLHKFSEVIALAVVGPLPHKHNDIISVPPTAHDLFVAHYNRGLIYFRLGDDWKGLNDIKKALEMKPHSVMAKEKLALAYRRLGKFDDAMGVTSSIIQEKAEEKKRRAMAAAQIRHKELIRATESLTTAPAEGEVDSLLQGDSVTGAGGDPGGAGGGSGSVSVSMYSRNTPREDGEKEVADDISVSTTGSRIPTGAAAGAVAGGVYSYDTVTASTHGSGAYNNNSGANSVNNPNPNPMISASVTPKGSRTRRGTDKSLMDGRMTPLHSSSGPPPINYAVQAMLQRAQKVEIGGNMIVSVKAKVTHRLQTGRVEGEDSSGGSIMAMSLKDFKALNGFKADLAETIFVQPTALQVALAHPPETRTLEHLQAIVSVLALVPSFQSTPLVILQQIAAVAEFRVFSTAAEVLAQNYPASCVGVVLRGEVQVRMEMEEAALAASFQSPGNLILEKIQPVAAFGHIDMLFANPYLTKGILSEHYGDQLNAEEAQAVNQQSPARSQMPSPVPMQSYPALTPNRSERIALGLGLGIDQQQQQHQSLTHAPTRGQSHENADSVSDQHSVASGVSFESHTADAPAAGDSGGDSGSNTPPVKADNAGTAAASTATGTMPAQSPVPAPAPAPALRNRPRCVSSNGVTVMMSLEKGDDMNQKERRFVDNVNSLERAAMLLGGGGAPSGWSDDEADDEEKDISESVGGCRPGIFMSYRVLPMTEILFIPPDAFMKHLVPSVRSELMSRLETIKACKIFEGFSYRSHVQLARMGMTQYYRAGEMIIDQGAVPDFLYLVTKGMCKAYKKPNKIDILNKNLDTLKQKAADHDVRYHFHHRLRHTMVPADDPSSIPFEKGSGMYPTQLEKDRYKLELEIKKLENTIAQLEKEPSDDGSDDSSDAGNDEDGDNDQLEEISVIQWPMLFGEACVINPATGISAGRIVADTPCEIFSIHKLQLQTFRIKPDFVELVKNHSILYPNDAHLVGGLSKKRYWDDYKVKYVQELRTRKAQLKELSKV